MQRDQLAEVVMKEPATCRLYVALALGFESRDDLCRVARLTQIDFRFATDTLRLIGLASTAGREVVRLTKDADNRSQRRAALAFAAMPNSLASADRLASPTVTTGALSAAGSILSALAHPLRLRLLGHLTADRGVVSLAQLTDELGCSRRDVERAIARLFAHGLLTRSTDGALLTNCSAIQECADILDSINPVTAVLLGEPASTQAAFAHGRLVSIDMNEEILKNVLTFVCSLLPDRTLSESEVNFRLSSVYSDVASLRRLMVEYGVLVRPVPMLYVKPTT